MASDGVTGSGRMGLVGRIGVWLYLALLGSWLILPIALGIAGLWAVLNALKILITGDDLQSLRTVGTAPAVHQILLFKYALFLDEWPGAIPSSEHAA